MFDRLKQSYFVAVSHCPARSRRNCCNLNRDDSRPATDWCAHEFACNQIELDISARKCLQLSVQGRRINEFDRCCWVSRHVIAEIDNEVTLCNGVFRGVGFARTACIQDGAGKPILVHQQVLHLRKARHGIRRHCKREHGG